MALAFGEFVFDAARRELRKRGMPIKVDPLQLDLLACFLSCPGVLLSKPELIERVWDGRAIADSALSVAVAKLRKALGHGVDKREYIENRYGRGYRFLLPVSEVPTAPDASNDRPSHLPPTPTGTPLVGRGDCLASLQAALSRALQGEGRLCALLGEPGIGKTRVAEALEQDARRRGARSAWGRFTAAEGTPPLWPLTAVLRELNVDGIADEALRSLDAQLGAVAATAQSSLSSDLTQSLLYDAAGALHRTIDVISRAILQSSERQPALLVLDDLQWADAATLRLLNYLTSELPRWPLLLLVTARSADLGSPGNRNRELVRLLSEHKCERIELGRLSEPDVAEYLAVSFPDASPAVCHTVYVRSQGNPFFMVELLRPFAGLPAPKPGQLHFAGLSLDVVRQRLAGVAEPTRALLSAAAVIGHDFDLGMLGYVADRSADQVLEALDPALADDTIMASARLPGAYAFDHELVREVLYGDLSAAERCRLHLRVGDALVRRRDSGLEIANAEVAHHYLSALPHGDVDRAVSHARRAARASMHMASHADARALLQRAFDALKFGVEPNPQTVSALLLELAMSERLLGDPNYVEHLHQGVALARKHACGPLLTAAGQMLSPSPGLMGQPEAASVLQAAAEVLPSDDDARRAIVLSHLAWSPPHCQSRSRVDSLLREASLLAQRCGDPEALATLRDARLFFGAGPENLQAAHALADEIDRQLKRHPHTLRSARMISTATFRLILALQHGDTAALQRAIDQRATSLARLNNAELNWHHERLQLVLHMNRGEFEGVAPELERLRSLAKRLRLYAWPTLWARDVSELLVWTGDTSALAARMRPGLAPCAHDLTSTLARKVRCLVEFGFIEDARAALARISSAWLNDLPHDRDYLAVICQLADASAALGSSEQRQVLYSLLLPHHHLYAADISFHSGGSVSHYLGKLARALGQPAAAIEHFSFAVERNRQFGLRAWALLSQYELASTLLAQGPSSVGRARELLAQTRAQALELGLAPLAQTCERHGG